MKNFFTYKGKEYGKGTIIKIYKHDSINFNCREKFVFTRQTEKGFCFKCLYTSDIYYFTQRQIDLYINEIIVEKPVVLPHPKGYKMEAKYIDGIIEAWTWYLLVMFGGLFIKNGTLIVWVLASYVFWSWRAKKMKGE